MEGFLHYLDNVIAQSPDGTLGPAYSVAGESSDKELILDTLKGYRGMGPVRVGNLALKQRQNDVYGAVIMATSQFFYDARLISPETPRCSGASRRSASRRTLSSRRPMRVPGSFVAPSRSTPIPPQCAGRRAIAWRESQAT